MITGKDEADASLSTARPEPKADKSTLRKQLRDVFVAYCAWGKGKGATADRLSNNNFMKMMRDAHVVSRTTNSHVLDIIFSRQCRGIERTIAFPQFEDVLIEVATRGKIPIEEIFKSIATLSGPTVNSQSTPPKMSSLRSPAARFPVAAAAAWSLGEDVQKLDGVSPAQGKGRRYNASSILQTLSVVLAELAHATRAAAEPDPDTEALAHRVRNAAKELDLLAIQLSPIVPPQPVSTPANPTSSSW